MLYKTAISLVLIAVLAMFISPVVDLPRSALRRRTAVQTILTLLAIVAGLIWTSQPRQKAATGEAHFEILFSLLLSRVELKTVSRCYSSLELPIVLRKRS